MKVKRIVSNVAASDVEKASAFYHDLLGLELLMDLGWIRTYGSGSRMTIQVSVASEGESGTIVPDMSIEVDDIDEALAKSPQGEESQSSTARGVSRGVCADSMSEIRSEN